MIHTLKTWPEPFQAIWTGLKHHEIRKADRDFKVGDFLQLEEWNPETKIRTGRSALVRITYISRPGTWGLPDDLCVMSISIHSIRRSDELAGSGVDTGGLISLK